MLVAITRNAVPPLILRTTAVPRAVASSWARRTASAGKVPKTMSTQVRKTDSPPPSRHYIPSEDLEAEAEERKRLRAEQIEEAERFAEHWTYPVSYITEQELRRETEVKNKNREERSEKIDRWIRSFVEKEEEVVRLRRFAETEETREAHFIPEEDEVAEREERERLRHERLRERDETARHWPYPYNYVSAGEVERRRAQTEREAEIRHHAWE